MTVLLRSVREDSPDAFFGPDRQRLALFVVMAAWAHLLAFILFGAYDVVPFLTPASVNLPEERYLELALEVAPPPEETPAPAGQALPPDARLVPVPGEQAPAAESETLEDTLTSDQTEEDFLVPPIPRNSPLLSQEAEPAGAPAEQDNAVSLEETAPQFKSYQALVRSAVARRWILPPEARDNFQPGRFTALMTLSRRGEVLLIVVEESSGSPGLDFAAMEALRGAAPYEPFSPDLAEFSQLNFRLHFDYRATVRRLGTNEPTPIGG
ncbi:MAG: TonB C-terminal domain-containing protein [Deltaproteobacteria bacterium]|nr:TonB C-terminal domain-containing protein [Deltaproteobacteria bacterium]